MKNNLSSIRKSTSSLAALILFLSLSSSGFSQNATISTRFFNLPDSSYLGGTVSAAVVIKNIDNAPYTGAINVNYSVDTVAFNLAGFYTTPFDTLNAGDSIITSFNITFDSAFYPGSNIVVVWSSGNGKFAADTLRDTIYLAATAGVHENNVSSSFSIFPSPAKDFIFVKMKTKEIPKQIHITDVFGRMVYVEIFRGDQDRKIDVRHLSPGIYFLELLYVNDRRSVQKFVRSD